MPAATKPIDRRAHQRFTLMPMYTTVEARRLAGDVDRALLGHAYDISETGVRIELDEALEPGESIAVHLTLPGATSSVTASADVVWVNDEMDDPGPRRMALRFTNFHTDQDYNGLLGYLSTAFIRRAA